MGSEQLLGFSAQWVLFSILLLPILLWLREHSRRSRSRVLKDGYIKLGQKGNSNVDDEYDDEKYAKRSNKWRVKALFIHPIKSCGAVELDVADVDAAGFTWDRKFAFAELLKPQTRLGASEDENKPRWTFRTLRQPGYEKLVHVKPEIWIPDPRSTKSKSSLYPEGFMIVKYPYVPSGALAFLDKVLMSRGFVSPESSFIVPLTPPEKHKYPSELITIWKDSPTWLNYKRHVPDDFAAYMDVKNPISLFRADPGCYREVYRCAPRRDKVGYQSVVGFADAYPMHLLNLASIRDVAEKVRKDISHFSSRRFRANILLEGPGPYDEDDWKKIRIGNNEIYCCCHTIRCRLPNVDPDTSDRHPVEPDKTLKSFRCIDDGDPKNAALGLQLVPATAQKIELRVGDIVEVLERGQHHYIKQ